MPTRLSLALVSCLLLAACGSTALDDPSASLVDSSSATAAGDSSTTTLPAVTTTTTPPDLTVFIAAVDAALAETEYSGAALSDPEVFIATGQMFCEMLDDGATEDQVLSQHLDALEGAGGSESPDADATASGVILGASTRIICRHHAP